MRIAESLEDDFGAGDVSGGTVEGVCGFEDGDNVPVGVAQAGLGR